MGLKGLGQHIALNIPSTAALDTVEQGGSGATGGG